MGSLMRAKISVWHVKISGKTSLICEFTSSYSVKSVCNTWRRLNLVVFVWNWIKEDETGWYKACTKRKYKNDNSAVIISHYIIECWKTFSTLKKLRTKLILIIATEGVFFGKRENISSLLYQDRSTCLRIVFPQHFSVPKFRPGQ